MENTFLIITSIADQHHPVLNCFARESALNKLPFILIGDTRSPETFVLSGCDFYSVERQRSLPFETAGMLPYKHYARKNLGYLVAMSQGAEVIIETDDDNYPLSGFWKKRTRSVQAHLLEEKGWVNIYRYFTETHIWPRGFDLEMVQRALPALGEKQRLYCPIQQGLADENPDVDAIFRLLFPLPLTFDGNAEVALGNRSVCPFNSQNTTWFKEAFPLMYLPSYCSFRMTDIWRSFVAQRVAWSCGWPILFHGSTVRQERNDHRLMTDFRDEIPGYCNNAQLVESLQDLNLKEGVAHIPENMRRCYDKLIELGLVDSLERPLLDAWLEDVRSHT